ncbi:beta-ribofuranosylaminobenzene 5'-phosphate synthase family protein [Paraburkholderia caballeronis]|uniref:beta-ribofuranosylaminobenzene 5'-phosphate synthase family protein n=1 Tax=Paraburkholderia caballeronis TaxID=416943 RepID=UPI00106667EE|nr:beta-ribofuranosylaminobenzene 5'-phosphate synthase family protein [Paraburkholderia caballeronis]TDV19553.1 beta-RFAP synthase [Paraburkholderia caballeronis]TDV22153.1 beta-RFAP synthase [Paraburkholderia caballeronis]TDV29057.1 beta-RFAP synthase [Paraburkholderia caballeronis]
MPLQFRRFPPQAAVTVDAPARLHLGFLDPNATLGRAFSSLGLFVDGPGTRLVARRADVERIDGALGDADRERVARWLHTLHATWGGPPVALDVLHTVRAHSGLGSGTQLALAVGSAFARIAGVPATTTELAALLGRGARSGIGVHGFDVGGLLLDGGPSCASAPGGSPSLAPLLSRLPFPDAWRVLLVSDTSRSGLSGPDERRGLAALAPFPQALAAHLCHLVLMRILPAVADGDFAPFARGLTEMQQIIGEYFAPVQGGVFTSPDVELAIRAVAAQQPAGIGQTSWGPTGFAIVASEPDAVRALAAARDATRGRPHVECAVVAARNRGATIDAFAARPRRAGVA